MSAALNPWEQGVCNVPMWIGGCPSGHCGKAANGHQLPSRYLWETRSRHPSSVPYCYGHACEAHGGPSKDEPRLFRDGTDDSGRSMWCAVMPDFINLQESAAGFDVNPIVAVANLRAAIAKATKEYSMTEDNKDALLCAKTLERSWAQVHCHFADLKEAAQHLRRLVAENEAKNALLRQSLEALDAAGKFVMDKQIVVAIREHLGEKP